MDKKILSLILVNLFLCFYLGAAHAQQPIQRMPIQKKLIIKPGTTPDERHYFLSFSPITHDFTRDRFNCGLEHKKGYIDVCAILWDPRRPGNPAPGRDDIERLLFGPVPYDAKSKNLSAWFLENSSGKLIIQPRAVLGWYNADKPPGWYWRLNKTEGYQARMQGVGLGKGDIDEKGFIDGHKRKWWEAITKASKEFNFADYDKNRDGKVTRDELAIVIVIPQSYGLYGCHRGWPEVVGQEYPKKEPLMVQGVQITDIVEWYAAEIPNLGIIAHEFCHLLLNADDISTATIPHWPFRAGVYSVMDTPVGPFHLDPFHKLKVGWLSVKPISVSGTYPLRDVETSGEALILCDPRRGFDEYFIVENRWRGSSHDAGAPPNGNGIPSDGMALWHIIEDQTLYQKTGAMRLAQGSAWGTQCIRLIRADGGIAKPGDPPDDSRALFTSNYGTIAASPRSAYFSWLDKTSVPFELKILTQPGPQIRVSIEIKETP